MSMIEIGSVLLVPVIAVIAAGSVVLISKTGGKTAKKKVQELNGIKHPDSSEKE